MNLNLALHTAREPRGWSELAQGVISNEKLTEERSKIDARELGFG